MQAEHGISLEAQEALLRREAEHRGYELVRVFVNRGMSGKNTERPELQAMLEMVRAREVAVVIIPRLDRLGRCTRDVIEMVEMFTDHGVELISLHEHFDTSSPMGRFVLRLFASLAEMEREMIVERVVHSMQHLRKIGRSTGEPPYGKKPKTAGAKKGDDDYGKLVDDEYEQKVLAIGRNLRIQGLGYEDIAQYFNQNGFTNRAGGEWKRQYVHRILNKPSPTHPA